MSEGSRETRSTRPGSNLTFASRRSVTTDSWIEISSQPSSSSLSSVGDNVHRLSHRRRSHRRQSEILARIPPRRDSATGSSQEEYDESESDSDRVLGSSNEDIQTTGQKAPLDKLENDTSTALGIGKSDNTVFTPQPNAFSHPPSQQSRSNPAVVQAPDSYFPLMHQFETAPDSRAVPVPLRPKQRVPTSRTSSTFRYSSQSSNRQADHDAALRASLTTLLSCAAAVRGTSKDSDPVLTAAPRTQVRTSQPAMLQLVPESHFLDDENMAPKPRSARPQRLSASGSPKRKARESSKDRQIKKVKNAQSKPEEEVMLLSPTLMSWMISAGVVLVFSAISFSAGYAWGKEVGRFEGETGISSGTCGREIMRSGGGTRAVRWSNATMSVRA